MSEPREERRAFDMAKRIRESGPDSLAGMPSEQIAGMLEEIASETRYLRRTRRAVIEKLEQARTDPETDDPKGMVEDARTVADFIVGWWPGLEDGINWGVPGERSGKTSEVYQAAKRLRDRLQAQEAGGGE